MACCVSCFILSNGSHSVTPVIMFTHIVIAILGTLEVKINLDRKARKIILAVVLYECEM